MMSYQIVDKVEKARRDRYNPVVIDVMDEGDVEDVEEVGVVEGREGEAVKLRRKIVWTQAPTTMVPMTA